MSEKIGHQKMKVWQNIDALDMLVQDILKAIPKNEFIMRSQIDKASDSVGANFVEGYYSGSTAEYLRFLRYGKRSLGELHERIRRLVRKNILTSYKYNTFNTSAIKTMYMFDRLIYALEYKLEIKKDSKIDKK